MAIASACYLDALLSPNLLSRVGSPGSSGRRRFYGEAGRCGRRRDRSRRGWLYRFHVHAPATAKVPGGARSAGSGVCVSGLARFLWRYLPTSSTYTAKENHSISAYNQGERTHALHAARAYTRLSSKSNKSCSPATKAAAARAARDGLARPLLLADA